MASDGDWSAAFAQAARLGEAQQWRSRIAEAARAAAGARFVSVWTCPPAQPLESRGSTAPLHLHAAIEGVITHLIPLVERTDDGAMRRRGRLTLRPYLPLEATRNAPLARRVRSSYAPEGVEALVVSWLLDEHGLPLGFIGVGDSGTGRGLLQRVGAPLEELAGHASRTLQGTLALARGLGALPPPPPAPQLQAEQLTVRERQVARLVAAGYTDERVSVELNVAEQTVGVHLRRIFRKLGVHSRNELLARGAVALAEEVPSAVRKARRGRRREVDGAV